MFFKRRGGVELISIIILSVILGAAAIGIGVGLSKNVKNTAEGGLSANNSHLSALYQSLEDELDYNPGESGVPGSPINIAHAHTGAEGDGPRINYFDLLNIPSKFTPESHDHNSLYYGKSEIDTQLSNKANASHDHNSLYYDKSEIDTKLSNKANASHNHNDLYYSKEETYNRSEIDSKIRKTARFTIGTTQAGWTAKDCDYLCDGTNDQEEIIQALNDLPATGGEVVVLDGTYNITASINIPKDNVFLRGNGNATILKRMYNSTNANSGPTARGLITLNEKSGCKIQGLQIDGNKATYTASYNSGIYLSSSSDNNTITGNTCNNNNNYGIYLYSSSNNNTVTGNTCNNNNSSGIRLASSSNNNTVTGNTCNNNSSGIRLASSSNNTVTGNTCNNNNSNGISLYSSSSDNTVTGNTCNNNDSSGIYLYSSSNNTVTGNTCNNNNSNGILLSSSSNNNTVTGNTCNNNNCGIYLHSSSNNTVTGNTCNNNSSYGIYLHSSCNYNCIVGNVLVDNGTAYYASGGTGNIEENNVKKNR
jgi:parallel beta-helix repeat protein